MASLLDDITNRPATTLSDSKCDCSVLTEDDIPGAKLTKDVEKCKKNELSFWLKCRGFTIKKSETRAQLCNRVRKCMSETTVITIVDPDPGKCHLILKQTNCNNCGQTVQSRKQNTISDQNVADHKKTMPVDGWTSSTEFLPPLFSIVNIVEHLKSTGKKQSYVEKPMDKGYKFFWDGYIHNVLTVKCQKTTYFKAKCFRSLKKNELPHSLSVCLDYDSGSVKSATCSCVAGVSGCCNHVFALLYAIDHCKKLKLTNFPKNKTCTEKPAEWSKCRTDGVHSQPVMELGIFKPRYGSTSAGITSTLYEARAPAIQGNSKQECDSLLLGLKEKHSNLGIFHVLNVNDNKNLVPTRLGFSVEQGSPLSYQLAVTEANFTVSENIDYLNLPEKDHPNSELSPFPWKQNDAPNLDKDCLQSLGLDLSTEECEKIEKDTLGQNSNSAWFDARKNRLTASKFGLVLQRKTSKNEKFVKNTIIEKRDLSHVAAVKYGLDNESKAVDHYVRYMKNARNNVKTFECGLVINSKFSWTGASPDRIVYDKNYGFGLLEVKCAHGKKSIPPIDACDDPSFFCYRNDQGLPVLKQDHHYYAQVQGQLGICGADWCDFVVYTNKGMIIQRIPFDQAFWDRMMPQLKKFYVQHVMPVLLT